MTMLNSFKKAIPIAISAALISACGGSSNSPETGTLSLGITDGPVEEASEVNVTISSIELKGAENKTITLEPPMNFNLLDYQGDAQLVLFEDQTLIAGSYQWMRLGVDDASIKIGENGPEYPLEIPSADQSGLKLQSGFTIGAGSSNNFTIDFDLRKSVTEANGEYKLRPTLRLVDNLKAGTLKGTVADSLVEDVNCVNNGTNNDMGNAVYLFTGEDATIQDLQGNAGDPLASATVALNNETSDYEFELGFIPAGPYTTVFTCDASIDINSEDNLAAMNFSNSYNLNIVANQTETLTIDN